MGVTFGIVMGVTGILVLVGDGATTSEVVVGVTVGGGVGVGAPGGNGVVVAAGADVAPGVTVGESGAGVTEPLIVGTVVALCWSLSF